MKRYITAFLSVAIFAVGCGGEVDINKLGNDGLYSTEQAGLGWNGLGWNGLGWNGLGWNGLGWNGLGWNGLGWNGLGWNGLGWNGLGWNGLSLWDWGLDTWVNGSDANGDSIIDAADRDIRLQALEYWTGCACPAGTSPTWYGWNPYTSSNELRTFSGNFGLAPTWCSGTGTVPAEERQAVSACLISRINVAGIHNALSVRGYESSLALGDNEQLFMAYKSGMFWGNLWEQDPNIVDPSDARPYSKSKAYGCYFPWGNAEAGLAHDLQVLLGRVCEWGGCPSQMKSTQACMVSGLLPGGDGSTSPSGGTVTWDPAVLSQTLGTTSTNATAYQDAQDADQYALWRGNRWRKMTVYLGAWANLESDNWKRAAYTCSTSCPGELKGGGGFMPFDSCGQEGHGADAGYRSGCKLPDPNCEFPTVWNNCQTIVREGPVGATSADCKPLAACVGGRKLTSLPAGQFLRVQFTRPYRYDATLGTWSLVLGSVNEHKAGTLAFRYSNSFGTSAGIQIKDLLRGVVVPASGFTDTGNWDSYDLHTVYPWYPVAPAGSTDLGVDIAIGSDPATPFPHLDYVQMWVGPPPGQPARELYWNTTPVTIRAGLATCSSIRIEPRTDLSQVGRIRFRPQIKGIDPARATITMTHSRTSAQYRAAADAPWSAWVENFAGHKPVDGTWDLCVLTSESGGRIDRVDVELEQR